MELRKAHTGEHLLFQALSRFFPGISVEKIRLRKKKKVFYLRYSKELGWEGILKALKLSNKIILQGRNVIEHLGEREEVEKKFPNLRAKWNRIKGDVRVIEIEDFDFAACSGKHVKNTKEVEFILVTKFNSLGKNLYELEFEVGKEAKSKALELSKIALNLSNICKTSIDEVERTVENLKEKNLILKEKLKNLTRRKIQNLKPEKIKKVNLYSGIFENLDTRQLKRETSRFLTHKKTIALFALKRRGVFLTIGRSKDLDLNLNEILREHLRKYGGKGGGSEEFASGFSEDEEVFERLREGLVGKIKDLRK
ncbi:MAG: DHHA1 domain-containing protein [Candidatus Methanofastidiosia archaeon]